MRCLWTVSSPAWQQWHLGRSSLRYNSESSHSVAGKGLSMFSGCLQLLEIMEMSLSLYGLLGNFCLKCRWSTALVSGHKSVLDHLFKKLVVFFLSVPWPHVVHIMFWLELILKRSTKCCRFGSLHSRPKQCKRPRFSWNPSWNPLEICSFKFVDTLCSMIALCAWYDQWDHMYSL